MAHHTQGSMLDILKKKMRQAKEEMENARDSAEEAEKRHALEIKRREDVRTVLSIVERWRARSKGEQERQGLLCFVAICSVILQCRWTSN